MKKRLIAVMLAGVMLSMAMMSGCGKEPSEKMQQYKELGLEQMSRGEYSDAIESFRKAIDQTSGKMGSEEQDLRYYKAMAAYEMGDSQNAIAEYNRILDKNKKNWEVYYLRGVVNLQMGNTEEALSDYEKATSLHSNDSELCVHIYKSLVEAGIQDQGQQYMDTVVNKSHKKTVDYYCAGQMYFLNDNYPQAEENLLLAKEGGEDEAMLLLGRIYAEQGKDDQAKAEFESYMAKYPDNAAALNELGEVAMISKEYEEALEYFKKAAEISGSGVEKLIHKNLIAAYEFTGDFESAYAEAVEFLNNWPDDGVEREILFLKTRVPAPEETEEVEIQEESDKDSDKDSDKKTDKDSDKESDKDSDKDSSDDEDEQ